MSKMTNMLKTYKELEEYGEDNFPDAFKHLPSLETRDAYGIDIHHLEVEVEIGISPGFRSIKVKAFLQCYGGQVRILCYNVGASLENAELYAPPQ
jgi:hypothetical protein